MHKKIPTYLTEINQLIGTLIFTVLFAIVYLNLYTPTSSTTWFDLDRSIYFFFTLGFISSSTGIVIISRVLMYKKKHSINFTYTKYILWLLFEVFIITFYYSFLTVYIIDKGGASDFFQVFYVSVKVVALVLLIPYSISWIYGSFNNKRKILRLIKYDEAVTDDEATNELELVHLADNNGNIKLSVRLNNLYYIESQDNYIKVYYLSDGELKNYILRCKLKTIEESFSGSKLVRCHRSFIINTKKIRVIRKEKSGTIIEMDYDGIPPIPISKGYLEYFNRVVLS